MDIKLLIDKLLEKGVITKDSLTAIKEKALRQKRCFMEAIYDDEPTSTKIAGIIEAVFGIKGYFYDGRKRPADAALSLVNADFAFKHMILPVKLESATLTAAFADPFNSKAQEELELAVSYRIKPLYTPWPDMVMLLDMCYGQKRRDDITQLFLSEETGDTGGQISDDDIKSAPAVKLLNQIIDMAVIKNASDIHIEPRQSDVRVRFRIDGRLTEFESVNHALYTALISRLKIMGGMDISEKRLPQDGRFVDIKMDKKVDFRISTVPALFGEKAVIRLLYEKTAYTNKTELGFSQDAIKVIERLLMNTNGAILLTGPTGSGKSTTMAAFLRELNTGDNNIMTVEDPVENVIHGINQININPKAGFTFPYALRSILRQDPDIIMVGEIRDPDTAGLAISSALTGHLVFSTLHTNDAISAIYRLIDMDVADYLVYTAVKGIISQRLVRKLCPKCKREKTIGAAQSILANLPEDTVVFEAVGCPACNHTGYKGRFAIYEILTMDDKLLRMFQEKKSREEIKAYLTGRGMKTLWECGLDSVLNGRTSFAEFSRAVFE